MAKRLWNVWFLSAAIATCAPVLSWGQEADKENVLALSRKIDEFIAAKQREAGVTPAPRAEERWICCFRNARRTYDLHRNRHKIDN